MGRPLDAIIKPLVAPKTNSDTCKHQGYINSLYHFSFSQFNRVTLLDKFAQHERFTRCLCPLAHQVSASHVATFRVRLGLVRTRSWLVKSRQWLLVLVRSQLTLMLVLVTLVVVLSVTTLVGAARGFLLSGLLICLFGPTFGSLLYVNIAFLTFWCSHFT